MLAGTMKPEPASTSKAVSCEPAESRQALPEAAPTEAATNLTQTEHPRNDPSAPPALETLMEKLDRATRWHARKGVRRMEIKYLDKLLSYYEARKANPDQEIPKPRERELSQYDEDEFQFLAHAGMKMFHPAMVHPARTELATRIYEEFYNVYRQGDLDALWDFLRSNQAQLQAIPAPPAGEGEERSSIETTLQKIRKVRY